MDRQLGDLSRFTRSATWARSAFTSYRPWVCSRTTCCRNVLSSLSQLSSMARTSASSTEFTSHCSASALRWALGPNFDPALAAETDDSILDPASENPMSLPGRWTMVKSRHVT